MIALFITSMVFFSTLGIAMNIRDARREQFASAETIETEETTNKAA